MKTVKQNSYSHISRVQTLFAMRHMGQQCFKFLNLMQWFRFTMHADVWHTHFSRNINGIIIHVSAHNAYICYRNDVSIHNDTIVENHYLFTGVPTCSFARKTKTLELGLFRLDDGMVNSDEACVNKLFIWFGLTPDMRGELSIFSSHI